MKATYIFLTSFVIWISALLFNQSSLLAQTTAGEQARRVGNQLTAIKLIEAEIEILAQHSIDITRLQAQIGNSLSDHKQTLESFELLTYWLDQQLIGDLESWFERLPSNINTADEHWITNEWLLEQSNRFQDEIELAIESVFDTKFPSAFEQARDIVVSTQRRDIAQNIYPTMREVENIERVGFDARIEVESALKDKMIGNMELLQENEQWVQEDVIEVIIRDALSQLESQRVLVENSVARDSFTDLGITNSIIRELETHVSNLKNDIKPGEKIYGIFPLMLEDEIPKRTMALVEEKFQAYIVNNAIVQSIDSEKIKEIMVSSPSGHYTYQESFSQIKKYVIPVVRAAVVMEYSAQIDGNENFTQILENLIDAPAISQLIDEKIDSDLIEPFDIARLELVKTQLGYFPTVNSNVWEPSEQLIVGYQEKGERISIINLGELLEIGNIQQIQESFFEESEEQLDSKVLDILIEGSRAIDAQEGLVLRIKDVVSEQFKNDLGNELNYDALSDQDRFTHFKERAIEHYADRVHEIWTLTRPQLVWPEKSYQSFMDDKYVALFERTNQLIEQVITPDYFSNIERPESITDTNSEGQLENTEGEENSGSGDAGTGGGEGDSVSFGGGGDAPAGLLSGSGSATGTICFNASDGSSIESFNFSEPDIDSVIARLRESREVIEIYSRNSWYERIPGYFSLVMVALFMAAGMAAGYFIARRKAA